MKNVILFLSLIALFSSCVTKKQRARICMECAGKDSVSYVEIEKVVPKDTTIYIFVPGPVQFLDNPCKNLCDSLGRLKPFKIEKKENGITSVIQSVGNSIRYDCKADSLEARIRYYEKVLEKKSYEKKVVPAECDRYHRTWLDTTCKWLCLVILLTLGIRYLIRRYWKIL